MLGTNQEPLDVFEGLQYGFDRRNLLTLQALARAKLAVEGVASDPGGCDCPKCLKLCRPTPGEDAGQRPAQVRIGPVSACTNALSG
jgi:hypothetical protein